jgi:hypothetical protein
MISNRFALTLAAGVAAFSVQAQGTISATATLTETGVSGSEYEYSLALLNTGTVSINAFWYGWVQDSFDLPGAPTSIGAPAGWSGAADGHSIQFGNSTGSAIAPEQTGTFLFESTFGPSAMTSGITDNAPTGDSVAYATVTAMNEFEQSVPGVASGPFVPTLSTVPEPSTLGLFAIGLLATGWRKWRRRSGD